MSCDRLVWLWLVVTAVTNVTLTLKVLTICDRQWCAVLTSELVWWAVVSLDDICDQQLHCSSLSLSLFFSQSLLGTLWPCWHLVLFLTLSPPPICLCRRNHHCHNGHIGDMGKFPPPPPGPVPRAGHFRYFWRFSMIKNDFFAFFIKLKTNFCTSPIFKKPSPGQINLTKNAKSFFIIEKIQKYPKCPDLQLEDLDVEISSRLMRDFLSCRLKRKKIKVLVKAGC